MPKNQVDTRDSYPLRTLDELLMSFWPSAVCRVHGGIMPVNPLALWG
jgi:hypothetical protein